MPPQRRALKLLVLLLALFVGGAIINVAVAWALPLRWYAYESDSRNLQPQDRDWKWLENQGWPLAGNYTWHYKREGLGWREDQFALKRPVDASPAISAPLILYRGRSGWPLYALEYYHESGSGEFARFDKWYGGMVIDGRLIGRRRDHGIYVNTSPHFPGFAINTVFYAAVLWMLFAVPGAVRRRVRIKRGQCPACAYPVGASDNCTECGKPVTTRTQVRGTIDD